MLMCTSETAARWWIANEPWGMWMLMLEKRGQFSTCFPHPQLLLFVLLFFYYYFIQKKGAEDGLFVGTWQWQDLADQSFTSLFTTKFSLFMGLRSLSWCMVRCQESEYHSMKNSGTWKKKNVFSLTKLRNGFWMMYNSKKRIFIS